MATHAKKGWHEFEHEVVKIERSSYNPLNRVQPYTYFFSKIAFEPN